MVTFHANSWSSLIPPPPQTPKGRRAAFGAQIKPWSIFPPPPLLLPRGIHKNAENTSRPSAQHEPHDWVGGSGEGRQFFFVDVTPPPPHFSPHCWPPGEGWRLVTSRQQWKHGVVQTQASGRPSPAPNCLAPLFGNLSHAHLGGA